MKILYVSSSKRIGINDESLYINDELQEVDGESNSDTALRKFRQIVASDLSCLLSHFSQIAVLTAAGTSMDNGTNSGKTRLGLWDYCFEELEKVKRYLEINKGFTARIKAEYDAKDIEHLLSFLQLYEKVNQPIKDEEDKSLIEAIEQKIKTACTLSLDETNRHHGDLIAKLSARKPSEPRLQLYTTNYDTLFEQAANQRGFVVVDGFSFSYPRVFRGINFDYDFVYRERTRIKNEESFVPNVFQLYKIHGSVNWEKEADGNIYQKEQVSKPCIVYPASNKYESSYEQPYFEMMSHFQQTLRKDGTLLIVIGFGFQDKHIQNVIKEAVNQNPNFHLLVVCYATENGQEIGIKRSLAPDFLDENLNPPINVSIIFSRFKDFVNLIPLKSSYLNSDKDEAI